MNIGFTGTQKGMSDHQKKCLHDLLSTLYASSYNHFLHGCCIGADVEAHEIALSLGYDIHICPPTNQEKVAVNLLPEPPNNVYMSNGNLVWSMSPAPYLLRNRYIATYCDHLIACPYQQHEIIRSGTWATVRYARGYGKPVHIIYP